MILPWFRSFSDFATIYEYSPKLSWFRSFTIHQYNPKLSWFRLFFTFHAIVCVLWFYLYYSISSILWRLRLIAVFKSLWLVWQFYCDTVTLSIFVWSFTTDQIALVLTLSWHLCCFQYSEIRVPPVYLIHLLTKSVSCTPRVLSHSLLSTALSPVGHCHLDLIPQMVLWIFCRPQDLMEIHALVNHFSPLDIHVGQHICLIPQRTLDLKMHNQSCAMFHHPL